MEKITYRQGMSSQEFAAYFFAVGFPAAVLVLSIVIVTRFGQFGQNLIAPMTAVMWGAGQCARLFFHRTGRISLRKHTGLSRGIC